MEHEQKLGSRARKTRLFLWRENIIIEKTEAIVQVAFPTISTFNLQMTTKLVLIHQQNKNSLGYASFSNFISSFHF